MKIQKRSNNRKKIILIAVAAILIIGAIGAYVAYSLLSQPDDSSVNYDKATNEQKEAGSSTKANNVNTSDESKFSSGSDQAEAPVPQDNGKGKISATMTAANQNGSVVQIRFDLGGVTSSGTCTMKLTKGATSVTKSAGVQAMAGSTTCKGFDVPTSELSTGTWQVSLHFENDELVADTTGTLEVQ